MPDPPTPPTMRRYTDYQDSGSDWIGQVPKHWDIGRLKDFVLANPTFKVPHDMTADDLVEFVPMTNVDETLGVISRFDLTPLSEVASGYRRFCNGDVIFAKITPCMENGNCAIVSGLSRNIGFGSTEFLVYRPKRSLNARYLHYFLHNDLFRKNAVPFMKGSAGQKRLPNDYVETHVFPLPPLPEQQAIADYLDAKTAQIDRKIDLLTQKVAKYRQLKQALINAAVTRGLDQSAPMKDSGVEWIGAVPAHWEIARFKDLFGERNEKGHPNEPLLIASQDKGVTLKSFYDRRTMSVQKDFHLMKLVKPGDYVISLRSFEGGIEFAFYQGIISAAYTVIYPIEQNGAGFYSHLFKSAKFISVLASCTTGIREGRNVSYQQLKRELIAVPNAEERQSIADYLDTQTAKIDSIVVTLSAQIGKLQDLRKSLINDVVTGKLRVT